MAKQPEAIIQKDLIGLLTSKGWYVFVTHGSSHQAGLPDLYLTHKVYGPRWIDVKNPKRHRLTPAQKRVWTAFAQNGTGVWILTAATDSQIELLFKKPNWHLFWKE